jgi:hypothetical protein
MTRTLVRMTLATAALVVAQALLGVLAPQSALKAPVNVPLVVMSAALVMAVLFLIAAEARDGAVRLAWVLFAVWGGIQANYLIETVVFDIGVPRPDQPWLFAHALAVSVAAAAIAALAARPAGGTAAAIGTHGSIPWLRVLGCGVIYLLLYFAAGLWIALPVTEPFYRQWPMPNPLVVVPLQVVRGAGFALVVLLLVRQTTGDRLLVALTAGVTLTVLGGVAPLLVPNAYLPDLVRLAHLAEIVVSNFAFGFIAAWLLTAQPWPSSNRTISPVGVN